MSRHVAHTFTAKHGDHDRTARSRSFWIIVTLIVLVSVGVTLLFALKLQREREVWEMNPPGFIMPLDRPAELAVAGDVEGALAEIEQRMDVLRGIVEDSDESFRRLGLYRDWDDPQTVITLIDIEMLLVFDCLIRSQFLPATADALPCDWAGRNIFDYRMERGLYDITRAFVLDAKGRDPAFVAALYLESGTTIANVITGWGVYYDDPERRELAARLLDFARARAARLAIIGAGLDEALWPANTFNPWCLARHDEICPGGVATYRAIAAYLDGDDQNAIDNALAALEGAQPWVYQSPYEHPLLWLLAASRRSGIEVDRGLLRPLIDAALSHWPIDARLALAVFVEEDDASAQEGESAWSTCTTPGCHYFVAAYLAAAGEEERASAMRTAGRELCLGVRSIPCAALGDSTSS